MTYKFFIINFFALFFLCFLKHEERKVDSEIDKQIQGKNELLNQEENYLQSVSFNPKGWIFLNSESRTIKGTAIFGNASLLVLYISQESCFSCFFQEIEKLEKFATNSSNLYDRVILILPFPDSNKLNKLIKSLNLNNVELYTRTTQDDFGDSFVSSYFKWENGKFKILHTRYLDDVKKLNPNHRDSSLMFTKGKSE